MKLVSFFIFLFFSVVSLGQFSNELSLKMEEEKDAIAQKNSFLALPFAYYSPETRWAFGATAIYNFYLNSKDTVTSPSQLILGAAWTQNKQLLFYVPYQFYWKENQWRATGEVGIYRYSYDFFGVGNDIPKDFEENYAVNYPRFRIHLLKKIHPSIFVGLQYWIEDFDIIQEKLDPEGLLIQGNVRGSVGGRTAGIGLLAQYDTRDNVYYPMNGFFVQGTGHTNSKYTWSEYAFDRYRVDFRYYKTFYKKHVLASQFFVDHITGQAPFSQLAFFGGTKRARGYDEGKFRDNNMFLSQFEYRVNIWKRLGAVAFYDYGMVADRLNQLSVAHGHSSYGLGLRLMTDVDKKVNMRFDYAFTPLGNNFYFTFGEAF